MAFLFKRFFSIFIVILVILIVGYLVSSGGFSGIFVSGKAKGVHGDIALKTVVVKKGDLRLTIAATGRVKPDLEVIVKSKASGEIIDFPFEEGDIVKKGEVVVRLDPAIERSRVNQAKADLIMAEARLEKADIFLKDTRRHLERQKILFGDKVISEQELDDAEIEYEKSGSDVKIAKAEIMRLEEALKEAEDRLQDTEVTAPLNGTILEKFVEKGQIITSGTSSFTEGTALFNMADLDKIYISASVDEIDVGSVQAKQKVSITVDAYPDLNFNGRVIRIAPKGRIENTITVFDVIIEVEDKDRSRLKPLMTANVEIMTDLRKGVLLVPSEAVKEKEGDFGVYIIKGREPSWVPLDIGETDGVVTEIRGNVKDGIKVLVSEIGDEDAGGFMKKHSRIWRIGRSVHSLKRKR